MTGSCQSVSQRMRKIWKALLNPSNDSLCQTHVLLAFLILITIQQHKPNFCSTFWYWGKGKSVIHQSFPPGKSWVLDKVLWNCWGNQCTQRCHSGTKHWTVRHSSDPHLRSREKELVLGTSPCPKRCVLPGTAANWEATPSLVRTEIHPATFQNLQRAVFYWSFLGCVPGKGSSFFQRHCWLCSRMFCSGMLRESQPRCLTGQGKLCPEGGRANPHNSPFNNSNDPQWSFV